MIIITNGLLCSEPIEDKIEDLMHLDLMAKNKTYNVQPNSTSEEKIENLQQNLSSKNKIENSQQNSTEIFLREKHLDENEYMLLAKKLKTRIENFEEQIYICHHVQIAKILKCKNIHVSFANFVEMRNHFDDFENVSVAVHNVEESIVAEKLGATSLVFGHVFQTECKKDLLPRGLEALESICKNVSIPVNAIGGIKKENLQKVFEAGANDFCIMSSAMQKNNLELSKTYNC